MTENNKLTISPVLKRLSYNLDFNLVQINQNYYLIDCSQSVLGNIFFFINWFKPLIFMEISRDDFEDLGKNPNVVVENSIAGAANHNKAKNLKSLYTVVGVFLGKKLIDLTNGLVISDWISEHSVFCFSLTLLFVCFSRWLLHQRTHKRLIGDLKNGILGEEKLYIKPTNVPWKSLLILIVVAIILCLIGNVFIEGSGDLEGILVFSMFALLYSLQSKQAFLPGKYKFKKARG